MGARSHIYQCQEHMNWANGIAVIAGWSYHLLYNLQHWDASFIGPVSLNHFSFRATFVCGFRFWWSMNRLQGYFSTDWQPRKWSLAGLNGQSFSAWEISNWLHVALYPPFESSNLDLLEIALRYHSTTMGSDWIQILPYVQGMLNNSRSASTDRSPNEIIYRGNIRETLNAFHNLLQDDYDWARQFDRQKAKDNIAFANIISKERYNSKHKAIHLKEGDLAFLRLRHGHKIPRALNRKVGPQRVGPFPVKRKVDL